jgi:hypothetical protein
VVRAQVSWQPDEFRDSGDGIEAEPLRIREGGSSRWGFVVLKLKLKRRYKARLFSQRNKHEGVKGHVN